RRAVRAACSTAGGPGHGRRGPAGGGGLLQRGPGRPGGCPGTGAARPVRLSGTAMAASRRAASGGRPASGGGAPRLRAAQRVRAALDEQRTALGQPAWSGPDDPEALGRASAVAVAAALGSGLAPLPGALRAAARYLAGLLAARSPGRAVEVRVP